MGRLVTAAGCFAAVVVYTVWAIRDSQRPPRPASVRFLHT